MLFLPRFWSIVFVAVIAFASIATPQDSAEADQDSEEAAAIRTLESHARDNVDQTVENAEDGSFFDSNIFDPVQPVPGVLADAPRDGMETFVRDIRNLAEGEPTWLDETSSVPDRIRDIRPEFEASRAARRAWDSLTNAQQEALSNNPDAINEPLLDASADRWNEIARERGSDMLWRREGDEERAPLVKDEKPEAPAESTTTEPPQQCAALDSVSAGGAGSVGTDGRVCGLSCGQQKSLYETVLHRCRQFGQCDEDLLQFYREGLSACCTGGLPLC